MLRLWRSAHRFDPDRGTEPAFVAAVARNAAIDMARHRATRPVTPTADIASLVPPGASPTEQVADAMAVRSALHAPDPRPARARPARLLRAPDPAGDRHPPAASRSGRSRAGPSKRCASSAGPWPASSPVPGRRVAPDRRGRLASPRGGAVPDRGGTWGPTWRTHEPHALRHLHGAVPSRGREPDPAHRPGPGPRQHLDRLGYDEAWIGEHHSAGHRDHRLARDLHRRRRRAHPPHQARHRRDQRQLPQPAVGGRAGGAARPHDQGPLHARPRPGRPAERRRDDRPRHARRPASCSRTPST